MSNEKLSLAKAMAQAQAYQDTRKLTTEQQYLKVIQALVSGIGGECCISPHVFGEPDTLTCEQDERGNILLMAKVSALSDA